MSYFLIAVGVVITVVQSVVFFKILTRLERRVTAIEDILNDVAPTGNNVEDKIATGLMKGMQMLKEDDDRTLRLLEINRQSKKQASVPMLTSDGGPNSFDTGGHLIPENLTKEEQEILKMFYDKNN